jgi:hypothetical protein
LLWRIMFTTLFTQQLKRVKDKILEITWRRESIN